MPPKGFKTITIREELKERLEEIARAKGFTNLNDVVAHILDVYSLVNSLFTVAPSKILPSSTVNTVTDGKILPSTTVNTVSDGSIYGKRLQSVTVNERGKLSRKKATMLDVIRERKIQFLSEVRPRNPDRFLAKARDYGIEVIEGNKDIALADPGFYKVFMEKLHDLNTSNEEKIKKLLDQNEYKLFKFLMENGLIYYDRINSRWKPV